MLVLTPASGGHFYGAVIAGITRQVAMAGGEAVVVLTDDPEVGGEQPTSRLQSDAPLAWDRSDALVALTGAVPESYLERYRSTGRPVVLVGDHPESLDVPWALPDNVRGTRAATDHLIEHGHTRIGFIGHLEVPDVQERKAAFLGRMAECGLDVDPADVVVATSFDARAGADAVRRRMAEGSLPTALLVGTDLTALGVLRELTAAGVRVPQDVALVGFDGIERTAYCDPPLTTVAQPFFDLGVTAARLALAQLAGADVASGPHRTPAHLVRRDSCGCDPARAEGTSTPQDRADVVDRLAPMLLSPRCTDVAELRARAAEVLDAVDALTAATTEADAESSAGVLMTLARGELSPYALRSILRRVISYARAGGSRARADALDSVVRWMEEACSVAEAAAFGSAIDAQAAIDAGLLGGDGDPRELGWLTDVASSFGLLALWEGDPGEGFLRVVGAQGEEARSTGLVGAVVHAASFPPAALIDGVRLRAHRVCVVLPVRTPERDWGLLAIEAETDLAATRGTYHHWSALLGAALDAQELQAALGDSEKRYADAARASNDGLWEWDLTGGPAWISDRARSLLGLGASALPALDELGWAHPDDQAIVSTALGQALSRRDEPVRIEFRADRGGDHRWLQLTAVGTAEGTAPVSRLVCSVADVHQRRLLEEQLREAAMFDHVTGLPNRRLFLDRLTSVLNQIRRRPSRSCAVLFLDLDGFKLVNDSLGHLHGDELLGVVARRLTAEIRSTDTAARFGGDEFAVLLVDPDEGDLAMIAGRIQQRVREPVLIEGQQVSVTASVGITVSGAQAREAEALLREADAAMYHAKATDRGSVAFFDRTMHAEAGDRLRLLNELRIALTEEQFVVHYQPIVPLDGSPVTHYEALVRWQHPERGLLLPGAFLPALESGPRMVELGTWILDQVGAQIATWRAAGHDASVAVNLSHREFWNPGLAESVARTLRRHGLSAHNLVLEITETVMLTDVEAARRVMSDLRTIGVRLSIDDFGTGQSSLHTLREFAVDVLKIDGGFVRGMESDPQLAELVTVILELGRALGLDVVAECVETPAQERLLRSMGCSKAQGWLYGKAMPGAEAGTMLGTPGRSASPERAAAAT
ncbi:EAL domain-containing protein [Isoptericola sp. b490]|nr:EAL domain-containing protein [Isoptericola sp. b490]